MDDDYQQHFLFIVGTETHKITAVDRDEAFTIANLVVEVPRNFYAWMDSVEPNTFVASTGVWD